MALVKFKASPLPLPPAEYSRTYIHQLIRVLELYFTQWDSQADMQNDSYRALQFYGGVFNGDGYGLKLPHVAASDTTDQYASGNDTATLVKWNTLDSGYGFTLNSPGSATADFAGVYKITYSLELINTDNSIHYVTVWLKINGSDVANSGTKFFIPARKSASAGEEGFTCAYSEVTFQLDAGDDIELYWATDKAYNTTGPIDGVYILHEAAQTTPYAHAAIPSAVGSITFVSAIPSA